MENDKKKSDRDTALLNILERLSDQLQKQELRLDEIVNLQFESSAALEKAEARLNARWDDSDVNTVSLQVELSMMLDKSEARLNVRQNETGAALEKFNQDFLRYRSDMLSLVLEQDKINENFKDMLKRLGLIVGAQDSIDRTVSALENHVETRAKADQEYYEHSYKQMEALSREIAGLGNETKKLHIGTEKLFEKAHREILRQLTELEQATTRRLLSLDGIESKLEELMIRTKPREKKAFWVIRVFSRTGTLFAKIGRFFISKAAVFSRRRRK